MVIFRLKKGLLEIVIKTNKNLYTFNKLATNLVFNYSQTNNFI